MPTLNADLSLSVDGRPGNIIPVEITYSYYAGRRPNDERAGYPDTGAEPEVTIMGLAVVSPQGARTAIVGALRAAVEDQCKAAVRAYYG